MSQDKIGTVIRSLVAMPKQYLGVVLDIANKLGGSDGAAWYAAFTAQLKAGVSEVVATTLSLQRRSFRAHNRPHGSESMTSTSPV